MWKYGSIDVLEDDEGVVLDDIINDFLNTTDERPRISMWYGKVNQHNWNGTWMTDSLGVLNVQQTAAAGEHRRTEGRQRSHGAEAW